MKGKRSIKLTRHNGRFGKNGVYNPRHNDRNFDVNNSEHIDPSRVSGNIYWDRYHGFHAPEDWEQNMGIRFAEVEKHFYFDRYFDFCEAQHERNRKTGHPERDRTTDDLLKNKKTAPEESILQIGTMDEHISHEVLSQIAVDYFNEFHRRFGEHVHLLDWSLHMDEATPHIHERHVFDCENRYGEIAPQQEKALEMLGIPLPFPDQPPGRTNNRKIAFDAICRELLFDIARSHGVMLDHEPEYGGRAYLEKQDYILLKQKEQLAAQEKRLDELSQKLENAEALIDEVTDIAYEKAVESVTDTVVAETQKRQIAVVKDYQKWLLSPERKQPKKDREFAVGILGKAIDALQAAASRIAAAVRRTLLAPEAKQKNTELIKAEARESILALLHRPAPEPRRRGPSERQHKQDHER